MLLILGAGILINFHKLQVTAVKTETSTVSETTTVQEPIIVSETTTEQEPVTKVTYSSVGGSEYELTTFKEKLVVGEKGQIRRPQNSPLKDSIYSFAMTVSDPSVLSFDEEGNWTAHKAGKTDITFGFPSGDSAQAKKFNEELTKLNVELEVKDVAVTMTITVVEPESQVMYRLYNPNNKEHFYTASLHEKVTLVDIGWGFYEGIAWQAPSKGIPVYRLYNPILKDHHYTLDQHEVRVLSSQHGWKEEGIAWYSGSTKKVHRLFHKGLTSGSHHYTLDENEVKVLQTRGWNYEGIAWYGQ